MMSTWSFLCVILLHLLKVNFTEAVENDASVEKENDTRRPIWNMVNMVNSIKDVDGYINQGANTVGIDVFIDSEGIATHAYFGLFCDDTREHDCAKETNFVTYMEFMRNLTSPDSDDYRDKLVLLYMACYVDKLSPEARVKAGEDIATKLLNHYWEEGESGARAFILISIKYTDHIDFIESFRSTLNKTGNFTFYEKRIGYEFHGNEDLDKIQSAYKKAGIKENIWQGDGVSNRWLRCYTRLQKCIKRRDNNSSNISKVYWWTVDTEDKMQEALWLGIDAILTNSPVVLNKVLNQYDYKRAFKLATHQDSPWEAYTFEIPSE